MGQKILLISYNYYPMVNPRALRWTAIAEQMAALGHEVHIVCSKVSGEEEIEVINGVNIYRVGLRSQSKPGGIKNKSKVSGGILKKLLKFIYNNMAKYFIWPDSNMFWITPAVKKANEIIKSNEIKKMISISHPFAGHVVGRKLANKNDIKWIVDIGDPFAFLEYVNINNKFLFGWFNYFYEKKVIRESYKQCVTTPLTTKEYLKHGFDCEKTMVVIPPLLRELASIKSSRRADEESINWIFVGTLYKKIRSPKYLLELFSEVNNLDKDHNHILHFYGETKMCKDDFDSYSNMIGNKIILHGLVTSEYAQKALAESDVLVSIGNKTRYQLPSKLVEYIALGKPIINIKSIKDDSAEHFLSNYKLSVTVSEANKVEDEAKRILSGFIKRNHLSANDIEPIVNSFKIRPITKAYISLFD